MSDTLQHIAAYKRDEVRDRRAGRSQAQVEADAKAADRQYDEVVEGYFARHRVKPGITGWAQVNGWRGETATVEQIEQRVRHDLYYIRNWSLVFDIRILLMTATRGFSSKQAY